MRSSSVGWLFDDEEAVLKEAEKSTEITHNHPEGIKGAQAIALGVLLGRKDCSKMKSVNNWKQGLITTSVKNWNRSGQTTDLT